MRKLSSGDFNVDSPDRKGDSSGGGSGVIEKDEVEDEEQQKRLATIIVDEMKLERERYKKAKEESRKTKGKKKVKVSIMKRAQANTRGSLSEGPVAYADDLEGREIKRRRRVSLPAPGSLSDCDRDEEIEELEEEVTEIGDGGKSGGEGESEGKSGTEAKSGGEDGDVEDEDEEMQRTLLTLAANQAIIEKERYNRAIEGKRTKKKKVTVSIMKDSVGTRFAGVVTRKGKEKEDEQLLPVTEPKISPPKETENEDGVSNSKQERQPDEPK